MENDKEDMTDADDHGSNSTDTEHPYNTRQK